MTKTPTAPSSVLTGSAFFALLMLAGCAPSEYIADYGLQPGGAATLDGGPAPGKLQRAAQSVRYEDERLAVDFTVYSSSARLEIENRLAVPLFVIWSETRIEGDFDAPLILAEPGPYDQRALPQQPTVVESGERERHRTIAGPPGRWRPFTNDETRGFWRRARPMFDLDVNRAQGGQAREALAERALGNEFRLMLVFEIDGERSELVLPARVVDVKVRASYY